MVKSLVIVGGACGLAGSAAGSNLALVTDDGVFKIIMLVILPVIAFYVLRTKDLGAFAQHPLSARGAVLATAGIAACVGVYDGFYGPGTGTFLILLLTGVAHLDLTVAAGTTKSINLATNVAALAVFLVNGAVLLPLGLAAGAFNIVGNLWGSKHFTQQGSSITRPIILVVIVLFACKLVGDLLFAA
jgi:uncharacterized membrane protein YfcA